MQLMNDKAHRLGLANTHFENPNGLDSPGHYSTARDLATLAAYAMENPIFAKTVSTRSLQVGQRYLSNHNKLLWQIPGADGVKTGYTKAAGRILVSSAIREGRRLICVTIHAPDDWQDHKTLLEEGFSRYAHRQLVSAGQELGELEVIGGREATVQLIAEEDFYYAMAEGEQVTFLLPAAGYVFAPVVRGQEAGYAHILVDGTPVGKVPVVYAETIEMEETPRKNWWQQWIEGDRP